MKGTSDFYIDETTTITARMMTMPLAQQLSVISFVSVHKTSVSEYSAKYFVRGPANARNH